MDTKAETNDTTTTYAGDWPNDPVSKNDPVYGLEQEGLALSNLASAIFHIGGDGAQVDSGAVAHIGDAVGRHARRVEHFVAQLRQRDHAALLRRIPPAPENPMVLALLRDRLTHAAREVVETLGTPPAAPQEAAS